MTSPIVFLDTETTGLSLDDDIWEFAAIRREPDGTETEHHIFIDHDYSKCARLPESFRADHHARYRDHDAYHPKNAAEYIADIFRDGKPHVVGAVPNFDTERIARLINTHYPAWSMGWHYHLIDVENLMVGYLAGCQRVALSHVQGAKVKDPSLILPPWRSDDLAAEVGVTITEDERHTAMGDARWAKRIYDAVMDGAK
jgi:DNA polymerase III epsilon subunit-like protein